MTLIGDGFSEDLYVICDVAWLEDISSILWFGNSKVPYESEVKRPLDKIRTKSPSQEVLDNEIYRF